MNAMVTTSYVLDAAGNLIRLDQSASPDQLIPHAAEIATAAADLQYPRPWTLTIEQAIEEVRFAPKALVDGSIAEVVHSTGTVPASPFVFVPPAESFASDSEIAEMIEVFDQLPADHEGRTQIEQALRSVGIVRIPLLRKYSAALHEGPEVDVIKAYSAPGWISNTKVYRKAPIT